MWTDLSKVPFAPLQWPAIPFWLSSIYLYLAEPARTGVLATIVSPFLPVESRALLSSYSIYVIMGLLLWNLIYLYDLVRSTVSLMCSHFNISCFGLHQEPRQKRRADHGGKHE